MDEKIQRPDDEDSEGHKRVVADVTTEDDAEGHTHVILNAPDDDVEGHRAVPPHNDWVGPGLNPDEGGESHPRI